MEGIKPTLPDFDGNSVIFKDIASGIDLKYTVSSFNIKEEIIFKSKPILSEINFDIRLKNVSFSGKDEAKFIFKKEKFSLKVGKINLKDKAGKEGRNIALTSTLSEKGDKVQLKLRLDKEFLENTKTEYPVILDPSFEVIPEEDLYIDEAGNKYYNENLLVGKEIIDSSITTFTSLMRFELPTLPDNIEINSATLSLCPIEKGNNPSPITDIYNVTSSWPEGPLFIPPPTLGSIQGFINLTNLGESGFSPIVTLPNSLIEGWLTDPISNNGLALIERIPNSSENPIPMKFESSRGTCQTVLTVIYTEIIGDQSKLGFSEHETFFNPPSTVFDVSANLRNGNLIIEQVEYTPYPTKTTFANATITSLYNSRSEDTGWFGKKRISLLESSLFDIVLNDHIKFKDPTGAIFNFIYDQAENIYIAESNSLMTIKDIGGVFQLTEGYFNITKFSLDGRLLETKSKGYKTQFGWSNIFGFDRITTITNPNGSTTTINYDVTGKVESITYPDGSVNYTYSQDKLTQIFSSKGFSMTFGWDENDNVFSVTDPRGSIWYYDCAQNGKCLNSHDETGLSEIYNYYSNYTEVINENNIKNQVHFREDGILTEERTIYPSSADVLIYSYDSSNNIIGMAENPELYTIISYIDHNFPNYLKDYVNGEYTTTRTILLDPETGEIIQTQFSMITPAISQSTVIYDFNGNLISINNNGNITNITYNLEDDSFPKTKEIITPAGRKMKLIYDAQNNLISISDACNSEFSIEYPSGTSVKISSPEGKWNEITFSQCCGKISKTEDFYGETNYEYDANGNLTKLINPDGTETKYKYDRYSRMLEIDWNGKRVGYNYTLEGKLSSLIDERGRPQFSIIYDENERTSKVIDYYGNIVREYTYETEPGRERYPKEMKDAYGRINKMRYLNEGLLDYIEFWDGTRIEYKYDKSGRTTKAGNIEYHYNLSDKLERKVTGGNKFSVETLYGYDPDELPIDYFIKPDDATSELYNYSGRSIHYTVDECFNVTKIEEKYFDKNNQPLPFGVVETFEYDKDHLLTKRVSTNTTYEYDEIGRLKKITNPKHPEMNYEYTYDSMHRITSDTRWFYEYDTYGQLTKAYRGDKVCTYEYDIGGNMTRKTLTDPTGTYAYHYEYDEMNRVTEVTNPDSSTSEYFYNLPEYPDINAMLGPTKIKNFAPNGELQNEIHIEYSPLNFPKNIKVYDQAGNIIDFTDIAYDVEGRRIGMGDRSFYYEGEHLISEFREGDTNDPTDNLLLNYTYYATAPILMQVNPIPGISGEGLYSELFYNDYIGSVVGTTDDPLLNEPLKAKNGYYPYGTIEHSEGISYNPLKFAGSYYEPTPISYESPPVDEMYSMGTRMYDSTTCRFLTADIWGPGILSDPWTIHSYHYCKNDPVNKIDPMGLVSKEKCGTLNCEMNDLISKMLSNLATAKGSSFRWSDITGIAVSCGSAIAGLYTALVGGGDTISVLGIAVSAVAAGIAIGLASLIACAYSIYGYFNSQSTSHIEAMDNVVSTCQKICKKLLEMNGQDSTGKFTSLSCVYSSRESQIYINYNFWGMFHPQQWSNDCSKIGENITNVKKAFQKSEKYDSRLKDLWAQTVPTYLENPSGGNCGK
ncbi:MAG TPA: RHS repeat-associated core domain-containing protein [Caldisericia bacterium]|nr:RHS repeat-associated core domain-containing protein [Caldisericia bacterium]